MNLELPPIAFSRPIVRPRRQDRRGFNPPPPIPVEQRRAIATTIQRRIREITRGLHALSPEAKRAVFLKLRHDRPITKSDLAGTGLALMSQSGLAESLVVPKEPGDLTAFEARIETFGAGDKAGRPKGTELAMKITGIEAAAPQDRLSDDFASDYARLTQREFVIYEIEVVSFRTHPASARKEVEAIIEEIRQDLGGVHGRIYEYEIVGRGARVLLSSTGRKLRDLVEEAKWIRKIALFDERPKFETFHSVFSNFNIGNVTITPPHRDSETICVIDTGVAAANPFLTPILRTDLSRSFIPGLSPLEDAYQHGSGVASLSAYYPFDISQGATNAANAFVVSARIMSDEGQLDLPFTDDIEADRRREARLLSNILREIVTHYTPLGVRLYVLAFQIQGHIWSQATRRLVPRNAWLARTIDQLSRKFDVVFVTITGNINYQDISDLLAQQAHPGYQTSPLAKLHDPGQAALAVTCGSIAHTANVVGAPHLAIALAEQPSPFSRSGPGFGDAIKPDFVERAGNLVRDQQLNRVLQNAGTNVVMASGRLTPVLQHGHGTSFAAPRVAHHLALIARDLRVAGVQASAPLLRAFLAASAVVPPAAQMLNAEGNRMLLGHGVPDGFKATDCHNHSVLLYWQGELMADSNAIFRIHVPAELANVGRGRKRITVAVASAPPVQAWGVEEYLGVEMRFRLYRGDRDYADIEAALQREADEQNEPAEHAVDDMSGDVGIQARSVGTLQRAAFEWSDHDPAYSADDYTLGVTLVKAGWSTADTAVPISVVVRIEDTTGTYQELYSRVRANVQARARAQA